MKKQDILTPIGLVLVIAAMALGIAQGDAGISAFVDLPSVAITIGGSFAALLITCSMDDIKQIPKMLKTTLMSNNLYKMDLVDQFKEISRKVRKDGVLSIEDEVAEIEDEFMKKGLELIIDGMEPEDTKEILETEITEVENKYERGSKMFFIWGSFAPAFGMIGTLIGLIQMLSEMGTPDAITAGMAKAIITTFYGAVLANAILNPIGFNIKSKGEKEVEYMEMMLSGINSIQNGDSTRVIEEKLVTFLNKKEKKTYYTRAVEGEGTDVA